MKSTQILKNAVTHQTNRAVKYDKPDGERSMERIVAVFKAYTDIDLTEEQGWLFMECLKTVRSLTGKVPREDDYEDLASYSSLRGETAFRKHTQKVENNE